MHHPAVCGVPCLTEAFTPMDAWGLNIIGTPPGSSDLVSYRLLFKLRKYVLWAF